MASATGSQGSLSASLGELIDAPGSESNIILASGDVIFVSEAAPTGIHHWRSCTAQGYTLWAPIRLCWVFLPAAGGPGEGADLGNVRVYLGGKRRGWRSL